MAFQVPEAPPEPGVESPAASYGAEGDARLVPFGEFAASARFTTVQAQTIAELDRLTTLCADAAPGHCTRVAHGVQQLRDRVSDAMWADARLSPAECAEGALIFGIGKRTLDRLNAQLASPRMSSADRDRTFALLADRLAGCVEQQIQALLAATAQMPSGTVQALHHRHLNELVEQALLEKSHHVGGDRPITPHEVLGTLVRAAANAGLPTGDIRADEVQGMRQMRAPQAADLARQALVEAVRPARIAMNVAQAFWRDVLEQASQLARCPSGELDPDHAPHAEALRQALVAARTAFDAGSGARILREESFIGVDDAGRLTLHAHPALIAVDWLAETTSVGLNTPIAPQLIDGWAEGDTAFRFLHLDDRLFFIQSQGAGQALPERMLPGPAHLRRLEDRVASSTLGAGAAQAAPKSPTWLGGLAEQVLEQWASPDLLEMSPKWLTSMRHAAQLFVRLGEGQAVHWIQRWRPEGLAWSAALLGATDTQQAQAVQALTRTRTCAAMASHPVLLVGLQLAMRMGGESIVQAFLDALGPTPDALLRALRTKGQFGEDALGLALSHGRAGALQTLFDRLLAPPCVAALDCEDRRTLWEGCVHHVPATVWALVCGHGQALQTCFDGWRAAIARGLLSGEDLGAMLGHAHRECKGIYWPLQRGYQDCVRAYLRMLRDARRLPGFPASDWMDLLRSPGVGMPAASVAIANENVRALGAYFDELLITRRESLIDDAELRSLLTLPHSKLSQPMVVVRLMLFDKFDSSGGDPGIWCWLDAVAQARREQFLTSADVLATLQPREAAPGARRLGVMRVPANDPLAPEIALWTRFIDCLARDGEVLDPSDAESLRQRPPWVLR